MNLVRERERESKKRSNAKQGKDPITIMTPSKVSNYTIKRGIMSSYPKPHISRYFVSRRKNYSVVEKTYSASSV